MIREGAEERDGILASDLEGSGRNPREQRLERRTVTAIAENSLDREQSLMEAVVDRGNMVAALARVRSNGGSAGIDKMTVEALPGYLREHWPRIKEELLSGSYAPQAVRRVDIPKPGG